jgi:hypothetical protein
MTELNRSRFVADASSIQPLGVPTTVDNLTPEQIAQNRAHVEAIENIRQQMDEDYLAKLFDDDQA